MFVNTQFPNSNPSPTSAGEYLFADSTRRLKKTVRLPESDFEGLVFLNSWLARLKQRKYSCLPRQKLSTNLDSLSEAHSWAKAGQFWILVTRHCPNLWTNEKEEFMFKSCCAGTHRRLLSDGKKRLKYPFFLKSCLFICYVLRNLLVWLLQVCCNFMFDSPASSKVKHVTLTITLTHYT